MPTSQLVIGGLIYSDPRMEGLQKVMKQLPEGETHYLFAGIFQITREGIKQIISSSSLPKEIIRNNLLYACSEKELAKELRRFHIDISDLIYVEKKNIHRLYERLSIQDNPYDRIALVSEYEAQESLPQKLMYAVQVTTRFLRNRITSAYQGRDDSDQPVRQ